MPRPIEAQIHLDALAHNLQRARAAAPDARVWAVIKASGYGHGIDAVYHGLRGADGFALLDIADAQRLRALDWRGPILLLEGTFEARDLEWCSRLHLQHVIHRDEQIDWLAMHKTEHAHQVVLKMNSGMNRLGFEPRAFRQAYARLNALPQVDGVALMTHFSDADALRFGEDGIAHQLATFEAHTADLDGERSLANSAALLRHAQDPRVRGDWVRPGVMLYGSSPDYPEHDIAHWGLEPGMTLRSRIIAVQEVQPGQSVGYGSIYRAERALRIGVVACGYADGYPRTAPGSNAQGTPALVEGQRTRTVGRVSMDMLCVDLGGLPHAGIGSEVVLWGRAAGGEVLAIDEVAAACGTLGYELMCALTPRVAVHHVLDHP
ncbi:MAG: alanine racemase [Aquabacterium sp.]|jgi:alanine racemase|nr:MAG: alanine racemase [Aquabacterium sp.]TAL15439.1 MAG: alanine racemase [Aquabacterium sp.]